MKKGFFAHKLCFGDQLLDKHVLYMSLDNHIDSAFPFQREVSLTTFCEGILFVVDPVLFAPLLEQFKQEVAYLLESDPEMTICEAVLSSEIYHDAPPQRDVPCALFAIPSINWNTLRIDGELIIERIV